MKEINGFILKSISNKLNINIEFYQAEDRNKLVEDLIKKGDVFLQYEYKNNIHYEWIKNSLIKKSAVKYLEARMQSVKSEYDYLCESEPCLAHQKYIKRALEVKYIGQIEKIQKYLGKDRYDKEVSEYIKQIVPRQKSKEFEFENIYKEYMISFFDYVKNRSSQMKETDKRAKRANPHSIERILL